MIEVENLTKEYGTTRAIENVNFSVQEGEILGFLGPNGAGKTTTMRVLSGYFPPTHGRAKVAGFDVFEQPLEVKKRIGYLPENPPLYDRFTVDGFLKFVARIKGVPSDAIDSRMSDVKKRCGLTGQGDRLIKHLSKGFRQRVGLAQALIHDPPVLILDEPTVGLDPKQIIEVRELIKDLGSDRTIILSTHILPEVSMTCERVIIINNGRIVAVDTPSNLTSQLSGGERVEIEVTGPVVSLPGLLADVPGVRNVILGEPRGGHDRALIEISPEEDVRPLLVRRLVSSGFDVYQISAQAMSLEEIFLKLTTEEEALS